MQRLIRTFLADRRLAELTTCIKLAGYAYNEQEGPWAAHFPDIDGAVTAQKSLEHLATFYDTLYYRDFLDHMESQLAHRTTSAYCTTLLALLPNLESLDFALYQDPGYLCQSPLKTMYNSQLPVATLGQLRRVSESLNAVRQLKIPGANIELLCFFELRQLQRLELDFTQQSEDTVPLNGLLYRHRDLSPLPVQAIDITCGFSEADPELRDFSAVEETLTRIQHEGSAQGDLTTLEVVTVRLKDLPHFEEQYDVMMDTLTSHLEPIFTSVRQLTIESTDLSRNAYFHYLSFEASGAREVLTSLKDFDHLQRLEVFQASIVPRAYRSKPHPTTNFRQLFPSSLETLVIIQCSAIVIPWLEQLLDVIHHFPAMRQIELRCLANYGRRPSWFEDRCRRVKERLQVMDLCLIIHHVVPPVYIPRRSETWRGCFWEMRPWSDLVDIWAEDWPGLKGMFSRGLEI
tara:strand:+ start:5923 stop:7299 length:1377 start_codon:yes stop_codon:yes gene_type:complete